MSKSPASSREHTIAVASRAFEHFRHGLITGEWQSLLDMLSSDFVFWFPVGPFRGENHGRERMAAFFESVGRIFPDGLELSIERTTANETTAVFECRGRGTRNAAPYETRLAFSLDVRGDTICAYREYFGLIDS